MACADPTHTTSALPNPPERGEADAALRRLTPRVQRVAQAQRGVQQQAQLGRGAQLVQRLCDAAQRLRHLARRLGQAALEGNQLQLLGQPRRAAQRHKQLLRLAQLGGVAAAIQVGVERLQLAAVRQVGLQLPQHVGLRSGAGRGAGSRALGMRGCAVRARARPRARPDTRAARQSAARVTSCGCKETQQSRWQTPPAPTGRRAVSSSAMACATWLGEPSLRSRISMFTALRLQGEGGGSMGDRGSRE